MNTINFKDNGNYTYDELKENLEFIDRMHDLDNF